MPVLSLFIWNTQTKIHLGITIFIINIIVCNINNCFLRTSTFQCSEVAYCVNQEAAFGVKIDQAFLINKRERICFSLQYFILSVS